jgi:hypothetical protein
MSPRRPSPPRGLHPQETYAQDGVITTSVNTRLDPQRPRRRPVAGRCDVTPMDDAACGTLACPDSSPCRTYQNLSAGARCAGFGQCRAAASCTYQDTSFGTSCSATQVCDGKGGCSLGENGSTCAGDGECHSGACVQGKCGVRTCAQLAYAPLTPIELSGIIQSSAPSGNPAGGAVLLSGDFSDVVRLCFDGSDLAQPFADGFNVMFQMPAGAAIGAHTIRAIRSDGQVSTAFSVQTVAAYSNTRSIINPLGGSTLQPLFSPPFGGRAFVPIPKVQLDPITTSGGTHTA